MEAAAAAVGAAVGAVGAVGAIVVVPSPATVPLLAAVETWRWWRRLTLTLPP